MTRAAADLATELDSALAALQTHLDAALDAERRARAIASQLASIAHEGTLERAFNPDLPPSAHRRQHRPGRAPILDTDAELRAFVMARLDRMTFEEIADEIARHFPPERQLRKSAIHTWWKRQSRR